MSKIILFIIIHPRVHNVNIKLNKSVSVLNFYSLLPENILLSKALKSETKCARIYDVEFYAKIGGG